MNATATQTFADECRDMSDATIAALQQAADACRHRYPVVQLRLMAAEHDRQVARVQAFFEGRRDTKAARELEARARRRIGAFVRPYA